MRQEGEGRDGTRTKSRDFGVEGFLMYHQRSYSVRNEFSVLRGIVIALGKKEVMSAILTKARHLKT
jgi:hypothetical protein